MKIEDIAAKHLGQSGSYAVYTDKFDPSLLVPMPRSLARNDWGINGNEFVGVDVWHCHEATFLTDKGLPVAGTLKVIYPCDTEFMVESKSFKLYCNSFDMCKMGESVDKAIRNYVKQIKHDLVELLKCDKVYVHFFLLGEDKYGDDPGRGYIDLLSLPLINDLQINDYKASENHLQFYSSNGIREVRFRTNILRSRCRHTKQKDTGEAFFYIKTQDSAIDPYSLLRQVCSLREVNEFHEFCAEKLYVDLIKEKSVKECCVMLLYSRRGSLDINPVRSTSEALIPQVMLSETIYTQKQMGQ